MAIPCILFAKEAIPGKVKTRLQPPLTPIQAASLYMALVRDTINTIHDTEGLELMIACAPDSSANIFSDLFPGSRILAQGPGNLGQKMNNVISRVAHESPEGLLIVGGDHPGLGTKNLTNLVAGLRENSVCFLPTEDGGYAGLALKKSFPELFENIPWSTDKVLSLSLGICKNHEISTRVLNPIYDVDRPEDLDRLIQEAHENEVHEHAPHVGENTKKALKELNLL